MFPAAMRDESGCAAQDLHHQVGLTRVEHARVERFDDVRVADAARSRRLTQEALDHAGHRRHGLVKQLQRAAVLGELVLDLVDRAHAALTQTGYDAKLSREQGARCKRAVGHQR